MNRPPESEPPPSGTGSWAEPYPPEEPPVTPYGEAAGPAGYGVPAPMPEYGGRWRRLLAAIIDGLVVYAVVWVVTAPLVGFGTVYDDQNVARRTIGDIIALAIGFFYYTLQHGRWGQTIGKRAMSLRVVREEDGGPITYRQAGWRLLFQYLISILTCGIGGLVDVAWILWDHRRQALHDKVAKTVVLRADPRLPDPYVGR